MRKWKGGSCANPAMPLSLRRAMRRPMRRRMRPLRMPMTYIMMWARQTSWTGHLPSLSYIFSKMFNAGMMNSKQSGRLDGQCAQSKQTVVPFCKTCFVCFVCYSSENLDEGKKSVGIYWFGLNIHRNKFETTWIIRVNDICTVNRCVRRCGSLVRHVPPPTTRNQVHQNIWSPFTLQ